MFDYEKIIEDTLVEVTGVRDVGLMDPFYEEVSVTIPPKYAEWLSQNADVSIMQPDNGASAFSSIGPGKFAVQHLVSLALGIVRNLIEAGVPESIALEFLPHDIYKRLPIK